MDAESTLISDKMVSSNYDSKIAIVKDILDDVKERKDIHYQYFARYKKMTIMIKTIVNSLNAISISGLVMTFIDVSHIVNIIALTSTSISTITSAISTSIDLDQKMHQHQTSYLQYTDLYRDVSARILKNGLSSTDLDKLLTELNTRLGIIEDQSNPITIK